MSSKGQTASEVLGLSNDNKYNSPWQFPNCPECDRHIYVDRYCGAEAELVCYLCNHQFDLPDKSELREELQ